MSRGTLCQVHFRLRCCVVFHISDCQIFICVATMVLRTCRSNRVSTKMSQCFPTGRAKTKTSIKSVPWVSPTRRPQKKIATVSLTSVSKNSLHKGPATVHHKSVVTHFLFENSLQKVSTSVFHNNVLQKCPAKVHRGTVFEHVWQKGPQKHLKRRCGRK